MISPPLHYRMVVISVNEEQGYDQGIPSYS